MAIDHVTIRVHDLVKAKAFYTAALAPLDYAVILEFADQFIGLGAGGKADLWLGKYDEAAPAHVAISAGTKERVNAFYAAALAAGGRDNGAPGTRKEYHPGYYGAFVLDPEGNNIEAVIHDYKK